MLIRSYIDKTPETHYYRRTRYQPLERGSRRLVDFLNFQTLGIFTFYIVPGVVATFVYSFIFPSDQRKLGDYVIELVVFGVLFQGAFFWLIMLVNNISIKSNQVLYNILVLLVVVALPGVLGYVGTLAAKSKWRRRLTRTANHPTSTAWDYALGKNVPYYIIFHLKSGEKLGGLYSGESFASSYPKAQEVYVQELYHVTDKGVFGNKVDRTQGAVIRFEECSFIELLTA